MKKIVTILVLFLFFYSCSENVEELLTGSINGSVSDRTTGEPVPVVNVSLLPGGESTVTGSDGSFSFENLDAGQYVVTLQKDGYEPAKENIVVDLGEPTMAHLLIERIPASLTVDKTLLDFGESLSTLSFTIVNTGYSDLAYKVETGDCLWLSVDPETDVLEYGKTATVVVEIDRNLLASGENKAMIVVRSTSGGGNVEVEVTAIGEYKAISSLVTREVSDITDKTAVLNGEITNVGAPAYNERGFVYSAEETQPVLENTLRRLTAPVTKENKFSVRLEDLSASEMYYVRAYLVQNEEVVYGNVVSFSTTKQAAEVSTSAVTEISATSATLNANVINEGIPAYAERGFCYSLGRTSPTVADNRLNVPGTGTGSYSLTVDGLSYPAQYYVRAFVVQDDEIIYGNTVSFVTQNEPVVVTTSSVTRIEGTSARLNGIIEKQGEPPYNERGFCYSSSNPMPTISDHHVSRFASNKGNFYEDVDGLKAGTTYFVRAFAVQDEHVVYGDVVAFDTEEAQIEPVVQTDAVTGLERIDRFGGGFFYEWEATFNGTVIDAGSPAYVERGFVYGNYSGPTVGNGTKIAVPGSGEGSFSASVGGLGDMQTYYVRAYVKAASGEYVYGNSVGISTF